MIQVRLGFKGTQAFRKYPTESLGIEPVCGVSTFGIKRLPTDSIGNNSLTLTNLVIGSAVEVEVASGGTVIVNTTAAATSLVLTIPVYQQGSTSNSIRIKVRKGSASPYYRPYETLFTVAVGSASVYISQTPDE